MELAKILPESAGKGNLRNLHLTLLFASHHGPDRTIVRP